MTFVTRQMLVALTGMSAFQARTNPWLVWAAFAVTAVGTVLIFVAGISDLAGAGVRDWRDGPLPIGMVTLGLGSAAFGIATYRASVLSRKGASSLAIGPVVGFIGALAADALKQQTVPRSEAERAQPRFERHNGGIPANDRG